MRLLFVAATQVVALAFAAPFQDNTVANAPSAIPKPNITGYATVDFSQPQPETTMAGGVLFCTAINYGGDCTYFTFGSSGKCFTFSGGDSWNDVTASVKPDAGKTCFLYADIRCPGSPSVQVTSPGIPDLHAVNFYDQLSSFACYSDAAAML